MKLIKKLIITLLLVGGIFFSFNQVVLKAHHDNLESIIEDIINWKKSTFGAKPNESLFNNDFLSLAGTTSSDWYLIGLGRYGYNEEYSRYLAAIRDQVNLRYQTPNKLDKTKATEWHRISLAISAVGGDPTSVGQFGGNPINLIADGTYNRGLTTSLGRQGINGWIWGLITLDSKNYKVDENAFNSRQDFIIEIIKNQLSDGGFALYGEISDPDITAMAIQALAPYYNSEIVYTYQSSKLKDDANHFLTIRKKVKDVIDEAVTLLSNLQTNDGDYLSWGIPNAESTVQVLVALTSLGINPLKDNRFIKNGKTILDGILKYKLGNGGFIHSFVYDPDNPSSKPNEANSMTTEQVLYGLVSLHRFINHQRRLYDMQQDFTKNEKTAISDLIKEINNLNHNSSKEEVDKVLALYYLIPFNNRSYISNYWFLSNYAKKYNLKLPDEDLIFIGKDSEDSNNIILYFSESNKQSTINLPLDENLTTKYYQEVVNLRYILDNSEEFLNKEKYKIILEKAYNQITLIQSEIDNINQDVLDKLHPFENIGIKDEKIVQNILNRYHILHQDDQEKIKYYEDILKASTKIKNIKTSIIISSVLVGGASVLTGVVVYSAKRRKRLKLSQLPPESDE